MSSLAEIFKALNQMRQDNVVGDYALGGATAVLFYAEPTRTYDIDVFVSGGADGGQELQPLSGIYAWARIQGFPQEAEHIFIHGVPIQFLPPFNALVEEAIANARMLEYGGVPVRVVDPEHLVALALQAGGARRRERAWQLLESGTVDRAVLRDILERHGVHAEIPDDV